MRRTLLISFTVTLILVACNDSKRPNASNFTTAINQYLVNHGQTCTWIGHTFPVDVSGSEQKLQSGVGPQMRVFEAAGLVYSFDTVASAPGIFGPGASRQVKRYEPTDEGKKYLREVPGVLGQTAGFCYGDKTVDSIMKWTEPVTAGSYSQTEVTYTYKIADLAPWAERSDVQREFGDVRTILNGISKSNEIVDLQLTNRGWEVPAP